MALIFGQDIRAGGETICYFTSLDFSAGKFTRQKGLNVVA
jgi:hypothetical protein